MKLLKDFYAYVKYYSKFVDFSLIIIYVILGTISVVMVYSASMVPALQDADMSPTFFFNRQLAFFIFGAIILFIMSFFMSGNLLRNRNFQVITTLGILLLVIYTSLFGVEVNGERNWMEVPGVGFRLQPSELFKIMVIMYLAYIYDRKRDRLKSIDKGNFVPLILIGIGIGFIISNDFGTGVITIGIMVIMFVYTGIKLRTVTFYMIIVSVAVLIIGIIRAFITGSILSAHQINRIDTFLHPFNDPLGTGYQITNALIAISHGGVFGQGLGNGIMKLGYLPEPHTDFIMAVIGEEFGLVGVLFILSLYLFLAIKAVRVAYRSNDLFYRLMSIGVTVYITLQLFVNVGGISKLIPLTGVPLPLMSYGGSSFLSMTIAIGLLVIASKHTRSDFNHEH